MREFSLFAPEGEVPLVTGDLDAIAELLLDENYGFCNPRARNNEDSPWRELTEVEEGQLFHLIERKEGRSPAQPNGRSR